MKKLILLVALFVSSVFAQEEEQEIRIELESGGSPAVDSVALTTATAHQIAAMPDGSVWQFSIDGRNIRGIVHCHVNEDGNPRCEEVDIDD